MKYLFFICVCLCLAACNSHPEQEPEEEPCPGPDLNSRFVYGDIPNLAVRLAYMGMERPADSYNYQLYPGMEEWAKTREERLAANQVEPECILRKMSTQAVIQAIWEMPQCGEFFWVTEGYWQRIIESQINRYNSFQELTKRKDAGAALLARLSLVDPITVHYLYTETQVLELLLSQPVFLSQLNESEKRKVVEITLSNDKKRQQAEWWWGEGDGYYNHSAVVSRSPALILMGKTMLAAGYRPLIEAVNKNEELRCFIDGFCNPHIPNSNTGYSYLSIYPNTDRNVPQIIIDYAKNYIND